jgi:hypothetical protein
MPLYALVRLADDAVVETRDFADPPPDVTRKGIRWLPMEVTDPACDPATQVKSGPVETVGKDRVTRVWTVRDMTAAELDAAKDAAVDGVDAVALRLLMSHENRIRALEGKQAIAAPQFKTALKALL